MVERLIAELAEQPVAWMNDDDGDIVPNMDENIDMSRHGWIPLYAHPDPRVAELEGLLRDILSEAQFPGSLVSMSNVMKERIAAALGKEGS